MTDYPFSVLYYLPGDELSLIEIRRNDLGDEQEPGKLFHWLLLDDTGEIQERLAFVSMTSTPDRQLREFVQGSLTFDQQRGLFLHRAHNRHHALVNHPVVNVPQAVLIAIRSYLDQGDARHAGLEGT